MQESSADFWPHLVKGYFMGPKINTSVFLLDAFNKNTDCTSDALIHPFTFNKVNCIHG